MPQGLHAPRYSEVEFPGYPSICRQNICFIGKGLPFQVTPQFADKTFVLSGKAYLNRGILFRSNPIFQNGWVCQANHILSAETHPIPKVFLSKQARVHAPWVSVMPSESLILIRRTDWGLMRHSLREKNIQGWYMTICYV